MKDGRKLAAILAADVVDYTRLMGANEESALAALNTRRALFDELVKEFDGLEFGSVGDSLMAEFPSAENAVRCALAIQQRMEHENTPLPSARRMHLRIGVNLGDVIEENGFAYGDTVNVAARLQALAKPGGVMISGPVYDQVHHRLSARFIAAGTRQVKNVAEPVRTFEVLPAPEPGLAGRIAGILARIASRRVRRAAAGVAALGVAVALGLLWRDFDVPDTGQRVGSSVGSPDPAYARSVAVLAFKDSGESTGAKIFAEGVPETVLHQLGRIPGLTVIARSSSFAFRGERADLRDIGRKLNVRYLLEGSVQTAGQRLRVTSSLVDAETGVSVWSMQFDRAPQDVFAVQDEIAAEVARAMRVTLDAGTEAATSWRHGATRSYEAYLAFLRGRALLANARIGDLPEAVESLTAAIRHDSKFAAAYVLLARARIALAEQDPARNTQVGFPQAVEGALQLLEQAIVLDPNSGEAYVERGYLKMYFDLAAADTDFRRGLALAPNHARGHEGLAAVLFQSAARRKEALAMIERARRLDPLEPRLDVIKATYLHYGLGDTQQASQLLQSVLDRNPLYVPALVRLGGMRSILEGEHAESVLLVEQAVKLDPGNETAWRQLAASYLEVDDIAAAETAFRNISDDPPHGWLSINLARRDWRNAGEAAYAKIAADRTRPEDERRITLAVRMHARTTGDYARAIRVLEDWALVSWDGDEPVLEGQLDMGLGVVGLADMLTAIGQKDRARALATELLADTDFQISRYGRGEIWLNEARAIAMVLLDRPEDAIATLRRQAKLGALQHDWRFMLAGEPLFEALRKQSEIQSLLTEARANAVRERSQLERMRADGLVPMRG